MLRKRFKINNLTSHDAARTRQILPGADLALPGEAG